VSVIVNRICAVDLIDKLCEGGPEISHWRSPGGIG
jgi:hypothetical protein